MYLFKVKKENIKNISKNGEEGESTPRQSTQAVPIFTMGHFVSICRVGCTEIWSETRLEFAVGRNCM